MWRAMGLALRVLIWRVMTYQVTHPRFLRIAFGVLRRVRPIFIMRKNVLATRHEDVKAVLCRDADFTSAEYTQARMLGGSFIINIDWPDQHRREESKIQEAFGCPGHDPFERFLEYDEAHIRAIVSERCQSVIADARRAGGEFDVALGLARRVTQDVIEHHYGVPAPNGKPDVLAEWLQALASAIIALPPAGSRWRHEAEDAADRLRNHIMSVVRSRSEEIFAEGADEEPQAKDDILTRMIKLKPRRLREGDDAVAPGEPHPGDNDWVTDDWICRMIVGLLVFGTATVVRTTTDTIDELLKRPRALADAQAAARDVELALGNLEKTQENAASPRAREAATRNLENTRAALLKYIYEALRFRPMLPILARYCPRVTVIARNRLRGRAVPAGARVIVPPLAAMFDARVFRRPGQFRVDRPLENYLLFGAGQHACIGQWVADIELEEIVGALLRLDRLERAPGARGRVGYTAAAATRLFIRF
jgi:cytochrome P450